ncbi:hypothetical protein GYMLUDRAFT_176904 [Collybiopsis luxurians FD-317 M1]|uniref:Major facilitator superfamily (MFS) profile domain-containing protein n=1 Tax=Collybiopsis luxurians FD-317 M1 TaxID=944289 RepID=A0A0D0CI70_9AGAR|nr:hypothetical protein GYMLUDRAFT_176904 [Collybiopsis luxurians FD-317 M1]
MRTYTVVLGLFAGFGEYLRFYSYDTGIITTSIAHESFINYMHNPNPAMTGAIVATFIAGEIIGAVLQMAIGDRLGRRRFMQVLCIIVTIGTVVQTAAVNYAMFLVGRILTGVALGGLNGTVPVYNSEIAPPEHRGVIGGLAGYMIGAGTCLANWVGYACGFAPSGNFQWRFPLALQIPPGPILFAGVQFFLPESPRWLLRQGRDEEAKAAFTKIRGELTVEKINSEFETMKEQIVLEMSTQVTTFAEAWQRYRKRILIAITAQIITALSGINVIQYYQSTLYKQLGFTGQKVLLLAAIYGTIGITVNVLSVSLRLLDTVGRVKPLGFASLALSAILIYNAIMTKIFATSDNAVGKDFTVVGIYLYTAIYYLGINSTTWLYGVEILPVFLRNKVTGLAACAHFIVNISITEAGPSAFANIKQNYYYVFVAAMFVCGVIVFVFFPETKGRTLEMIAADFGDIVVVENTNQDSEKISVHDERIENV